MTHLTLQDLRRILVESAGDAELPDSGEQMADIPFSELGYDSLALIETVARIKRQYGVEIPSELIAELETPRALLDFVNAAAATP